MINYYEVLEISQNASEEVIKMAYKALAKKYHPDVFTGIPEFANEKMKEINEAFSVLSNADKRKEYDSNLANWRSYQESHFSKYANDEDEDDEDDDDYAQEKDNDSGSFIGKLMSLIFIIIIVPFLVYLLIEKLLWFKKDEQGRKGIAITLTIILFAALILWFIKKYLQ